MKIFSIDLKKNNPTIMIDPSVEYLRNGDLNSIQCFPIRIPPSHALGELYVGKQYHKHSAQLLCTPCIPVFVISKMILHMHGI